MTRSQFLGLLTLPLIAPFVKKEERFVFNRKHLQERIDYLKANPHLIRKYPLTFDECYHGSPKNKLVMDEIGCWDAVNQGLIDHLVIIEPGA